MPNEYLQNYENDLLESIRATGQLTAETTEALNRALTAFTAKFLENR